MRLASLVLALFMGTACASAAVYPVPSSSAVMIYCHPGMSKAGCPPSAAVVHDVSRQSAAALQAARDLATKTDTVSKQTRTLAVKTETVSKQTQELASKTTQVAHTASEADKKANRLQDSVNSIQQHAVWVWFANVFMALELLFVGLIGFLVYLKLPHK